MFRIKNTTKNSNDQIPAATAITRSTLLSSPSNNNCNQKQMSAIRLPFLIVNQYHHGELPCTPNTNFKPIPTTPATVQSMTPNSGSGSAITGIPSSSSDLGCHSHSAYVDLDSSVDMDSSEEDDACIIPTSMDAEFEAMLSPTSPVRYQCLLEPEPQMTAMPSNVSEDRFFSQEPQDDDESIASIFAEEVSSSIQLAASSSSSSRIGIARPSYAPSYVHEVSDVSPILNSRNFKQFTDPNDNAQYYQDRLYQEKLKAQENRDNSTNRGSSQNNIMGISSLVMDESPAESYVSSPTTNINGYPRNSNELHHTVGSPMNLTDKKHCLDAGIELDNQRFITPGQAFIKRERSLPRHLIPSKPSPQQGLGITPPPKTRSSRVLVPHVTPPSRDAYTIYILVIQPTAKMYELIRVNYNPATATIGDLLGLIQGHVTEESLKEQKHIGLCRPRGSSSSSRSLTNVKMTASVMARDGTCARILCGEVLVAIPEGYTGKEVQLLSQHILKLPKMKKLLQRPDPLLGVSGGRKNSKQKAIRSATTTTTTSSLGIQPLSKQDVQSQQLAITEIGTFSSSILFGAIHEETPQEQSPRSRRDLVVASSSSHGDSSSRAWRNDSKVMEDDDYSVASNYSRTSTYKSKLTSTQQSGQTSQNSRKMPQVSGGGLTMEQIEQIKREAAAAARIAAEEAFLLRMQELVEDLNVSPDEKAQMIQKQSLDDASFQSAMCWTCPSTPEEKTDGTDSLGTNYAPVESPRSQCSSPLPADPKADGNEYRLLISKDVSMTNDEREEMELMASCMEGFFAASLQAVTEFLDERKSKFCTLRNKLAKRNMALKAMAAACIVFLSTLLMSHDEDVEGDILFEDLISSSPSNEPFKMSDLQHIVFWFMMMVQGQNFVMKHKSKRKRRTWRSRIRSIERT